MSTITAENENRNRQRSTSATVLIVDDDPETIRLMLEILARQGVGAQVAGERRTAIESLERNRCDLAFISTRPGRWNHLELIREMRANVPELPVVVMARCGEDADVSLLQSGTQAAVQAIRAGCCDFLLKPLDRIAVENLLESLLPNRAVATAETRNLVGGTAWDRGKGGADISPLVAATIGVWAMVARRHLLAKYDLMESFA